MARPKAENKSIEKLLTNKIASIKSEIDRLNNELKQTEVILADYNKNRVTIETILGLQDAPDLAAPRKTRGKKGGFSVGN